MEECGESVEHICDLIILMSMLEGLFIPYYKYIQND